MPMSPVLESVAGLVALQRLYGGRPRNRLADARDCSRMVVLTLVIADWQLAAQETGRNALDAPDSGMPGLGSRILWMSSLALDRTGSRARNARPRHPAEAFQATDLFAAVDWQNYRIPSSRSFRIEAKARLKAERSPIWASGISSRSAMPLVISERSPNPRQGSSPRRSFQRK